MGFFRRLFARTPARHQEEAEFPSRVAVPLRKFKLEGKVLKLLKGSGPDEILAFGGCVKEAESADALRETWERDMKRAFPMGADYNVEYHCTVTPLDEDESDDDGEATALATAAAVGAVTMF